MPVAQEDLRETGQTGKGPEVEVERKMKNLRKSGIAAALIVTAVALMGCDGAHPGTEKAYQGTDSDACSQAFVDDYNDMERAASSARRDYTDRLIADATVQTEINTAISKANTFKTTYTDVACIALLNGLRSTIDAGVDAQKVIDDMNTLLGGFPSDALMSASRVLEVDTAIDSE
jgi:hypothetical protein